MSETPELIAKKARDVASGRLYTIRRDRDNRRTELRKEVAVLEQRIERQLSEEFDAVTRAAQAELNERQIAYEDARVAAAASRTPWAIGTQMERWRDVAPRFSRQTKLERSGEVGVLQVFKRGDAWPENQSHGKPDVGDVVIRPTTKSGKPAAKCVKTSNYSGCYGGWDAEQWAPVGLDLGEARRVIAEFNKDTEPIEI